LDIWLAYFKDFIARYGGSKIERLRDMFDQACEAAPANYRCVIGWVMGVLFDFDFFVILCLVCYLVVGLLCFCCCLFVCLFLSVNRFGVVLFFCLFVSDSPSAPLTA
jgi:hypothetical protein